MSTGERCLYVHLKPSTYGTGRSIERGMGSWLPSEGVLTTFHAGSVSPGRLATRVVLPPPSRLTALSQPISAILLLVALVSLTGAPYTMLMPVLAAQRLGGGAYTLGFLMAAAGAGAVMGALWLASRPSVLGLGRVIAVGIAKKEELLFTRDRDDAIALPHDSPALLLITRIRDEAHRFAVAFHRERRAKRSLRSDLDVITSIGPRRRKALLTAFGSLAGVRRATREELVRVVGTKSADAVLAHFAAQR